MAKKLYGAVVVFKEGTTKVEAQLALLNMTDDGGRCVVDAKTYESVGGGEGIESFDPDEGGPVWYIP